MRRRTWNSAEHSPSLDLYSLNNIFFSKICRMFYKRHGNMGIFFLFFKSIHVQISVKMYEGWGACVSSFQTKTVV